ncbi:hypothetical protein ACFL20_11115 [Spirochaetota bacterium]
MKKVIGLILAVLIIGVLGCKKSISKIQFCEFKNKRLSNRTKMKYFNKRKEEKFKCDINETKQRYIRYNCFFGKEIGSSKLKMQVITPGDSILMTKTSNINPTWDGINAIRYFRIKEKGKHKVYFINGKTDEILCKGVIDFK